MVLTSSLIPNFLVKRREDFLVKMMSGCFGLYLALRDGKIKGSARWSWEMSQWAIKWPTQLEISSLLRRSLPEDSIKCPPFLHFDGLFIKGYKSERLLISERFGTRWFFDQGLKYENFDIFGTLKWKWPLIQKQIR